MLLYQPEFQAIDTATQRAFTRRPDLRSRIDKAAAILADVNDNFDTSGEDWAIRAQKDFATWYTINPDYTCSCEDYARHAHEGKFFCKHLLAFFGYRRILQREMNWRTLGDFRFSEDRRHAQRYPGAMLIDTRRHHNQPPAILTYSAGSRLPDLVCEIRMDSDETWKPRRDSDYLRLSEWLAAAPTFIHPEERIAAYEEMSIPIRHREPDPAPWTTAQFRIWLDTGVLPALQTIQ
jgi:hypothetical protein